MDIHTVQDTLRNNNNNNHNNRRLSQVCPLFLCVTCCEMDLSWQPVTGAAQRRRGRRLRAAWRHEQQSIAQALATFTHHSSRGQRTARAGEWGSELNYTATIGKTPTPQAAGTQYFAMDVDEVPAAGSRPDRLSQVRPQERVLRRTVEQKRRTCALMPDTEQVIEVPKILLEDVPMRAAARDTQLAEQLVEVPTTPGCALAVVAVRTLGWREARALLEQLNTARPGRDTNTGRRDGG